MAETAIVFSAKARRHLKKLDSQTSTRIVTAIDRYAETGAGDIEKIKPHGGLRLRIGDWRVFFTQDEAQVSIDAILPRRSAYR